MNKVYIATSIDGYIADREGGLDWLQSVPNPEGLDLGYAEFMTGVDALVMGRKTFETVLGFGIEWPYSKPVYVLSSSLASVPEELEGKAELIPADLLKAGLHEVLGHIHERGHSDLYIDGGSTIQSFLSEDLVDELIISVIPVVLGGGSPLFWATPSELGFELLSSKVLLDQIVQNHWRRKR